MAQLVKHAQVFFPVLIDDVQQDDFLKLLDDALALCLVGFLQLAGYVVYPFAIGNGHHDALVDSSLILVNFLYYRPCHLLYAVSLALEAGHSRLECQLGQLILVLGLEFFLRERHLHGQYLEEILLGALVIHVKYIEHSIPNDVGDIHSDTLTNQGVATLLIDY